MERINELLEQKFLDWEEFEELESDLSFEDNGMSGQHYGWHWFSVFIEDNEYDIYVK